MVTRPRTRADPQRKSPVRSEPDGGLGWCFRPEDARTDWNCLRSPRGLDPMLAAKCGVVGDYNREAVIVTTTFPESPL